MHLFLFTNSAQRELVSICIEENTQPQLTFLALVPWNELKIQLECSWKGKDEINTYIIQFFLTIGGGAFGSALLYSHIPMQLHMIYISTSISI